ncbi:MAG TPA: prephenate dehydratase [Dissulfurispiraceae bacterium]|nr:prephenate dehydratase [Dissulfurispiraceae bacterium]
MKNKQKSASLDTIRMEIDAIDAQLLKLLNKRAQCAIDIAGIKRTKNLKFHSPERERAVLERLAAINQGPFPNDAMKFIFREIMSASLALEQPLKVAFLGPEGTFTNLAAVRHFGSFAQYIPVESIKAVFDAVEYGECHYGLVPIENSNEGVVSYTLDMFMDCELKIAAEVLLEVSHNLLSKTGEKNRIKRIFSHPQGLAQCRGWLEANMPGVPLLDAISTSKAAEIAASDEEAAAVASELAARIYDLKVIKRRIQDKKNNYTRFLVIAKESPKKTGSDKTSIMFSIKDKPGALYEVLYPFKQTGINLTKIESRPSKRRAWEYIFFVDMQGHTDDEKISSAIEKVKKNCLYLTVLGSYPVDARLYKR